MRSIERVRAGAVSRGEYIAHVDDDELTTDAEINASYDVDEQDWQRVISIKGHADVGVLVLEMYNGEPYVSPLGSWDQFVWRLRTEGGPVVQLPEDD